MKANELRIGNLVEISNAYTHRPKGYDTAYIHAINIDNCIIHWDREFFTCLYKGFIDSKNPHINPITLTEEWLVKFGFFHEGQVTSRLKIDCDYGEVTIWFKRIKYVHQLQNLYFALTNTELELKEEVKK